MFKEKLNYFQNQLKHYITITYSWHHLILKIKVFMMIIIIIKIIILNLFTLLQLYPLLPHLQEKEEINVMKSVKEILQ